MNIFVLDTDPAIAASYHCDQHLHKMILESAQMLSTVFIKYYPNMADLVYKPTHQNHPCTQWLLADTANIHWLLDLCYNLDNIRQSLNCNEHSSIGVIDIISSTMQCDVLNSPHKFVFAGPPSIEIRNLTIPQKYQMYYRQKHKAWLDTRAPMSYKNRPIPPFLQDLF